MYSQLWILLFLQGIFLVAAVPHNTNALAKLKVLTRHASSRGLGDNLIQNRELEQPADVTAFLDKRDDFNPNTYDSHMQLGDTGIWVAVNFSDQMVDWLFDIVWEDFSNTLAAQAMAAGDTRATLPGNALSLAFRVIVSRVAQLDFTYNLAAVRGTRLTWGVALEVLSFLGEYANNGGRFDLISEMVFYTIRRGRPLRYLNGYFAEQTTHPSNQGNGTNNTAVDVDLSTLLQSDVTYANGSAIIGFVVPTIPSNTTSLQEASESFGQDGSLPATSRRGVSLV